jgi:hypothetical protein
VNTLAFSSLFRPFLAPFIHFMQFGCSYGSLKVT